ncbi:hypothetical protein ACFX2A_016519 [Malus domestica]
MAKFLTRMIKCFFSMALLLPTFRHALSQTAQVNIPPAPPTVFITVDQSGSNDYTKIQDAIDAVPSNNALPVYIWVKPGIYYEKINVPSDKPFITISGSTSYASDTVITWKESGEINETAVFTLWASDFVGRNVTVQNTYGTGGKAVALRVSGDRVAFYGCSIMSHQDALFADIGKQYYKDCYIEGDTDFIFGSASSLFENCHMHSLSEQNGAITAQKRDSPSQDAGFLFLGGEITGVGRAVLGRPWGPYSTVIFAYTKMSNAILPQGWDSWGRSTDYLSKVYYGEYKCIGAGAVTAERVAWEHNVTPKEFTSFMNKVRGFGIGSWQGSDGGGWKYGAPPRVGRDGEGNNGGRQQGPPTPIGDGGKQGYPTPIGGGGQHGPPPPATREGGQYGAPAPFAVGWQHGPPPSVAGGGQYGAPPPFAGGWQQGPPTPVGGGGQHGPPPPVGGERERNNGGGWKHAAPIPNGGGGGVRNNAGVGQHGVPNVGGASIEGWADVQWSGCEKGAAHPGLWGLSLVLLPLIHLS